MSPFAISTSARKNSLRRARENTRVRRTNVIADPECGDFAGDERGATIPSLEAFYFGGVFFWYCFYAGVAAIINAPNTSSRSSLLFLPLLPMFACGLVASQPDGAMMRSLRLFPGTSSVAMPMRLVLGDVSTVDLLSSLILMVAGVAVLRLIAGRVFAAGIMLYGKEPSWLDIALWTLARHSEVAGGN